MMLFSRIVVFKNFLPSVIANTAIGMEAETVKPAFNARYTVDAPKIIPKAAPVRTDLIVSSAICDSGDTNGLNWLVFSAINWFYDRKIRKNLCPLASRQLIYKLAIGS